MRAANQYVTAFNALAAQLALLLPCWWCGQPIRYDFTGRAAQRHRDAFPLHHAAPLSRGGDLLDPANARSAHHRRNSARAVIRS
ncbi:hypothetical protein CTZ28_06580 [Streptomyces shenzhenensis]|uniref:HNH domain-containing protein n=1 Tax=Streptomyces shenzhenensis TaxID=943815 RepID=A0A3M0IDR0_9ACTN|nr:hypothetical protein CTZ28_06580 [Streptomyces shenzhenensis]